MESTAEVQQTKAANPAQHGKLSKRDLKFQRWESYRAEINRTYVEHNHTLQETMDMLKAKYQFTPSVRKFKEKMKEWKFEKYLTTEQTRFIAAKAKAREEEGKGTAFFKNGIAIDHRRIEKSTKRKREEFEEMQSSAVATPQQITYQTPHPDQSDDSHGLDSEQRNARAPSPEFRSSKSLDHHAVIAHTDEKGLHDLSRTPTGNLTLPGASAQIPIIIINNSRSPSPSSAISRSSSSESAEASTASQGLSSQPEITIAPAEESSWSGFDAGAAPTFREARKPGSRFFVHFGPLQDSKAVAESQQLSQTAINELQKELSSAEASDGISSINTLRVVQRLAERLEKSNEVAAMAKAERLYRRAILGFEALGGDGFRQRIDAQYHLGRLLHDDKQYNEAEKLLAAVAEDYKALQLDHLEISALVSLLELLIQLNMTGRIENVMVRMCHLLDKSKCANPAEMHFFPIAQVRLARVHFLRGETGDVWRLLRDVVSKLEYLNEEQNGIDKLEGYLEYGCMCQQREDWDDASKYLDLARNLLIRSTRHDEDALTFVSSRLLEIKTRAAMSLYYESPWDEARMAYLRPGPDRSPWNDAHEVEEISTALASAGNAPWKARSLVRLEPHNHSSTMGTGSSTYGSSGYGVTYPRSESTGGGISEFLYP